MSQLPSLRESHISRVRPKAQGKDNIKRNSTLRQQIQPEDVREVQGGEPYSGDYAETDPSDLPNYDNPIYTHGGIPWIDEIMAENGSQDTEHHSEDIVSFGPESWDSGWGAPYEDQQQQQLEAAM
jgi:hypothetical protein